MTLWIINWSTVVKGNVEGSLLLLSLDFLFVQVKERLVWKSLSYRTATITRSTAVS